MFVGFKSRWTIPPVQGCERRQHRELGRRRFRHRDRSVGQAFGKRFPVEQLHAEKRLPVVLTDVEELADVGMADRGGRARLADEPLAHGGIRCAEDGLDRDGP
jgi:hypothetical protein